MKRNGLWKTAIISAYAVFLIVSLAMGFKPGEEIGHNFLSFSVEMLQILPGAFILIGLFEVWVKRTMVGRYLGKGSGVKGYVWAVLLAGTVVGGIYVAFPMAYSMFSKGAKLSVIFTFIGAAAVCRVPMTIFEATFLGVKFTAIRFLLSLALVIITSKLLGGYLEKRDYQVADGAVSAVKKQAS